MYSSERTPPPVLSEPSKEADTPGQFEIWAGAVTSAVGVRQASVVAGVSRRSHGKSALTVSSLAGAHMLLGCPAACSQVPG